MTNPAMDPDEMKQMLAEYQATLAQGGRDKAVEGMMNQPSTHSTLGDLGRGAMTGLANSGFGTISTVGNLLGKMGATTVGPAMADFGDQGQLKSQEFYDPHGMAGRLGRGAGEVVGNGAQFMAGGEALGGEKIAAKAAGSLGRFGSSAFMQGAARALPGAAIHAAAKSEGDPTGASGFWGTLAGDEAAAGATGFIGSKLGAIGSRLMGLTKRGTPAPTVEATPFAPTAAPEPPVLEPQAPAAATPAPAAEAPVAPKETSAPATMTEEAPAPQAAAPTESPAPPAKAPTKAKAAKKAAPEPEQASAPTEAKPAAAPKTGSQKGGKAKPAKAPKASDSNSGAAQTEQWTDKDARDLANHEQYLPTAKRMREGLSDKTRADKAIADTEAEIARLNAKRAAAKAKP